MKSIIPVAGIPIYITTVENGLTSDELNLICSLEEKQIETGGKNYISLSRTVLNLSGMERFTQVCKSELDHYTKHVIGIDNNFEITDSWTTRNPKDTFHARHNHTNSIFSGVYYINPNNAGITFTFAPVFSKDFNFKYKINHYNIFNSTSWKVDVQPNTLVFFPSWVEHFADDNTDNEDRRILGFNSFAFDTFGSDYEVNNLTIKNA